MGLKQRSEKLFRGWFPQEPLLLSRHVKMSYEPKPPFMVPAWSRVSAKKVVGVQVIIWVLLSVFIEILFLDLRPPSLSVVLWLPAGLAIGAVAGVLFMRIQIRSFTINYRSAKLTKKESILIALPSVIAVVAVFAAPYLIGGYFALSAVVFSSGFWIFYFSLWFSRLIVTYFSYSAFEKRTNMRLVGSWTDAEVYVIPNPPNHSNDSVKKPAGGGLRP